MTLVPLAQNKKLLFSPMFMKSIPQSSRQRPLFHALLRTRSCALAIGLLGAGGTELQAQSAYIPERGSLEVSTSYTYFEFDEFYYGETKGSLPDPIRQHNVSLTFDYGIADRLAADLTVGYAYNSFSVQQDHDGFVDTLLGVRYQIWNEFEDGGGTGFLPSLSLRLGGIIEGTYEALTDGSYNSIGDSASGGEVSLLAGKQFGETGFGMYGDIGYRMRAEDVPDDLFGSIGVYQTLFDTLTVRFGYRGTAGQSGIDIFSPEFNPGRFPETKEILHNLEAGIGYRFSNGVYCQVFGAQTLDGRNTGKKTFLGVSISIPFGGGGGSEVALPPVPGHRK